MRQFHRGNYNAHICHVVNSGSSIEYVHLRDVHALMQVDNDHIIKSDICQLPRDGRRGQVIRREGGRAALRDVHVQHRRHHANT